MNETGALPRHGADVRLLRVGTYNLMDGGQDRWPRQMDVLAALDLDILGLQEAKNWDRDDFHRLHATADALGMQPLFAPSRHHGCHLVLLYRWPRVRCRRYRPDIAYGTFHHAAARARLAVDGVDQPLLVLNTHLHPFSPPDRLAEAGWLTEYAAPDAMSLIIGDLNTIGIVDEEPAEWGRIPAHLHSRHRLVLPDGTHAGADRRAMHALVDAGFIDPPCQLGITPPRTAGHWPGSEPWDHRSDHVLISPRLAPALHSHQVVDTPATRDLSDHLPVITTLDLTLWGTQ